MEEQGLLRRRQWLKINCGNQRANEERQRGWGRGTHKGKLYTAERARQGAL